MAPVYVENRLNMETALKKPGAVGGKYQDSGA